MSTPAHLIELRGQVPEELFAMLDAVAQATPGASRMSVLRDVLREWYGRERHKAIMVMRVCGDNGSAPYSDRMCTGCAPRHARRTHTA
jgi:hypothetical protein